MNLSKQIELIVTEGKHSGSHKFAFLRAVFDYVVEKTPDGAADLKIPLIFYVERFFTYYWKMFLYKTPQLTVTQRPLRYYEYLETVISELDLKGIEKDLRNGRHIHVLMAELRKKDSFSRRLTSTINKTRQIIFRHPVAHTKYISGRTGPVSLDFYEVPEGEYSTVEAKNWSDFYIQETAFITVRKKYISELKTMHYWFDKAVLLAWAQFTDSLPVDIRQRMPSGLSLLQISEPDRNNLTAFRNHFINLGVRNCAYCNERKFEAIDHVIPWSIVKADRFWNFLPICKSCNSAKSNRIWNLPGDGKNVLTKSIALIVDEIEDRPEYLTQLQDHFMLIRENFELNNKEQLKDRLYNETLSRIRSFALG